MRQTDFILQNPQALLLLLIAPIEAYCEYPHDDDH